MFPMYSFLRHVLIDISELFCQYKFLQTQMFPSSQLIDPLLFMETQGYFKMGIKNACHNDRGIEQFGTQACAPSL